MNVRLKVYQFICLFILGLYFLPENTTGQSMESGLYPVYNFTPKDYNALDQNFCVVQDHRGLMYFGNNQGILEYDGVNWDLIKTKVASPARSMGIDESGRIYIGSNNEFGYMEVDSIGQLVFHSLSDRLEEEYQDFNIIWKTHISETGVLFQAYHYIFELIDDDLKVIPSFDEIHESFQVGDRLYINFSESGLAFMEDGKFIPVQGGEIFSDLRVFGMIELHPGKILIATESDGFFSLELPPDEPVKAQIDKIKTRSDKLLSTVEIFNAVRISPNRISLGTWGSGCIIIDTLFNIVSILDKKTGLQNEIILGQYSDRSGNLWLALSNGVSRVETNTPLTQFTDAKGLVGTVQSITRFNNTVFVSTQVGLFYLDHEFYNREVSDFKQPVFRKVKDFDIECWDMITFKKDKEEILLVITNDAVTEFNKELNYSPVLIDYAYKLYQSKLDSNRLFIGLESGLTSFYREKNEWVPEGPIEGIDEMITSLSEDHMGNLWMGTQEEGVLKLYIKRFVEDRIQGYSISRYDSTHGLPVGPFIFSQFKGPPTVATNKGLFKFIMQEDRFEPDSAYGDEFADGTYWIHRITEFSSPEIWMVSISKDIENLDEFGVGYLEPIGAGKYRWISEPFKRLSKELTYAIYPDKKQITWLGGADGLYRFDGNIPKDYRTDFNAFIRNVDLGDGGIVFRGAFMEKSGIPGLSQPEFMIPVLPYSDNSLVFNFSAEPGGDESFVKFNYFLEGNDKNWSEWTDETYRVYTNLHEGKYVFRVKAMNVYGHISNEATYEFTILAPWYRKWWAIIVYILLAAVFVYVIVKVYTRNLRQIIRERTAEVVEQKEVIEEKNKDIMDSIQYAKKIQRALLPPEDDLGKLDVDGFILFLPRDIVSGDFYWIARQDGKFITVAADCTGHGVPGAFMSMLGVAFLNNIVEVKGITKASDILNELRSEVISALKQKGQEGEQKDGMDIALHVIDDKEKTIQFAGANNSLLLIRDSEIIQVKGDRMPIGIHVHADQSFENHVLKAVPGDVLYTFSDGYQDQFGGPKNKKFMVKKLKELFLTIHQKPMEEQKKILEKAFYDWIDPYNAKQIDDVIVIGVRI